MVHRSLDWPLVGLAFLVSSSSFLVVTTCALVTLDVVIQSGWKAYCHKCCTLPATMAVFFGPTSLMCLFHHIPLCDLTPYRNIMSQCRLP